MSSVNSDVFSNPLRSDCGVVIVQRAADFLGLRDIERCECVCRLFKEACKESWIRLSLEEDIRFAEGKDRDRKVGVQGSHSRTTGKERIRRFLGEPVGLSGEPVEVPLIPEVFLSILSILDPFGGRKMKDTFVFVVDYPAVKRTVGEETPLDLNEKGNLIELPANQVVHGKELIIPLSLKNLRVLCKYPLDGKQNRPVFDSYSSYAVFDQCGVISDKVNVYFMRRCVVEETRGMTYPEGEKFVNKSGFTGIPIKVRALYEALEILEFGTCPDGRKPRQHTYACCSDRVVHAGFQKVYYANIGAFNPGFGVFANINADGTDHIAMATGLLVEERPPLEFEPFLTLDKGH